MPMYMVFNARYLVLNYTKDYRFVSINAPDNF